MISRHAFRLREQLKKVWVRVVGYAVLAALSAGLARILSPWLPQAWAIGIGSEAVGQLLGVLTSTMLAVTTFSLSIAVSAFAAAAQSATPRATVLLQEDRTTQNVLATFLGAFLFGLLGLIALNADLYDESGKAVLFLFTVAVIGFVIVALIGWINHLMSFGRMSDTLDRVEAAAARALRRRLEDPYLGGRPLRGPAPDGRTVASARTGYVQHVDMGALQAVAEATEGRVHLLRLPGAFVAVGEPMLRLAGAAKPEDERLEEARLAVSVGDRRTFEEDPRFGLIVLVEIASRALSPAVNDPGTAIDILGRLVRVMADWRDGEEPEACRFPGVFVPPITVDDLVEDAFRPIARDGAGLAEVQIRLHKALASLRRAAPGVFDGPTERMSRYALGLAEAAAPSPADLAQIRAAAGAAPAASGT